MFLMIFIFLLEAEKLYTSLKSMKSVLTKYLFWDEKYLRKIYDLFIEKNLFKGLEDFSYNCSYKNIQCFRK